MPSVTAADATLKGSPVGFTCDDLLVSLEDTGWVVDPAVVASPGTAAATAAATAAKIDGITCGFVSRAGEVIVSAALPSKPTFDTLISAAASASESTTKFDSGPAFFRDGTVDVFPFSEYWASFTSDSFVTAKDALNFTDAVFQAVPKGTTTHPVGLGAEIVGDTWTAVVNWYLIDGTDEVAANGLNEAAPAGSHYEVVNYTVTYTGADSAYAAEVGVDLVTDSGDVITSDKNVVLDSIGLGEFVNGNWGIGSVAFLVPDGQSVLIRVRPGTNADETFVTV